MYICKLSKVLSAAKPLTGLRFIVEPEGYSVEYFGGCRLGLKSLHFLGAKDDTLYNCKGLVAPYLELEMLTDSECETTG